jgi:hypothetical protein
MEIDCGIYDESSCGIGSPEMYPDPDIIVPEDDEKESVSSPQQALQKCPLTNKVSRNARRAGLKDRHHNLEELSSDLTVLDKSILKAWGCDKELRIQLSMLDEVTLKKYATAYTSSSSSMKPTTNKRSSKRGRNKKCADAASKSIQIGDVVRKQTQRQSTTCSKRSKRFAAKVAEDEDIKDLVMKNSNDQDSDFQLPTDSYESDAVPEFSDSEIVDDWKPQRIRRKKYVFG